MNYKNKIAIAISSMLIIILFTIGISFAYFTANLTGTEDSTTITVTGGFINITYDGGANINISNIIPDNNPAAIKTFTVTGNNTTDIEMGYKLSLVINNNTFTNDALKYKLTSTNTDNSGETATEVTTLSSVNTGARIISLGAGYFDVPTGGNKVHTYNLELYFPDTGENQNINQNKSFDAHITVENYDYSLLVYNESKNVNKPVLFTGMTPIKWDSSFNEIETTENDPDWYDYTEKKWANAKTEDGSYWVWIPRYAYKITSGYHSSTTGTIDVKFLIGATNETLDKTKIETDGYVAGVKDTSMHYFLHPAFVFNKDELGFWVGKFHSSVADQTNLCYLNSNTTNCNNNTLVVKNIPNANSWRFINISNAFNVSLNMKEKTDIYGWNSNEIDTHILKSTEWGAITYLSKSKYGANTEEVWNNAYTQIRTGCSGSGVNAKNESTCVMYNTENGVKASTTHNIYGVYDMSGGAWDITMSNYNNLIGIQSGFTTVELTNIDSKYITRYTTLAPDILDGTGMNYDSKIYGDAMYETSFGVARNHTGGWTGNQGGSWYLDSSFIPYYTFPFLIRGSNYSMATGAGLFEFNNSNGSPQVTSTFRQALFSIK